MKEGVDEMIKYVANEPSVGLYYVQQHAQSSMSYLLNLRVSMFLSLSSLIYLFCDFKIRFWIYCYTHQCRIKSAVPSDLLSLENVNFICFIL